MATNLQQKLKNVQVNVVLPTPEHMLVFLVLVELALLVGLRRIFKTAHGG